MKAGAALHWTRWYWVHLLNVLLLLPNSLGLSDLQEHQSPSVLHCWSGRHLALAFANSSIKVAVIDKDITVCEDDWVGLPSPVRLERNFTVMGDVATLLNFNFVKNKVQLEPGIVLTVKGLTISGFRSRPLTLSPGLDLVSAAPPPTAPTTGQQDGSPTNTAAIAPVVLTLNNLFIIRFCFPPQYSGSNYAGITRSACFPGKNIVIRKPPRSNCTNSPNSLLPDWCWPGCGVFTDLAVDAVDIISDDRQVPANYVIYARDSDFVCQQVLPGECVATYGPGGCLLQFLAQQGRSQNSQLPHQLLSATCSQDADSTTTGTCTPGVTAGCGHLGPLLEASPLSPAKVLGDGDDQHMLPVVVGSVCGGVAAVFAALALWVVHVRRGAVTTRVVDTPVVCSDCGEPKSVEGIQVEVVDCEAEPSGLPGRKLAACMSCEPRSKTPSDPEGVESAARTTSNATAAADASPAVLLTPDWRGASAVTAAARSTSVSAMLPRMTSATCSLEPMPTTSGVSESEALITVMTPQRPDLQLGPECDNELRLEPGGMLGKGSCACVVVGSYRGERVAVKLLRGGVQLAGPGAGDDSELLKLMQQEVEILGRCRHPNVVRLLAANLLPPRPCLVMELMDTSLDRLMYGSKALLPLPVVFHIALDIARGLEFLHPTILHRDLKPPNVLINNSAGAMPMAKLSDFGLSRLHHTLLVTQHPEVGTPPYMAPECFEADNYTVSHKSDIYALGVLICEMVAGKPPWPRQNIAQIACTVSMFDQRPYKLSDLPPERCPPKLARLIDSCWEKDPQRRPAAAEVVKSLLLVLLDMQGRSSERRTGALGSLSSSPAD